MERISTNRKGDLEKDIEKLYLQHKDNKETRSIIENKIGCEFC